MRYNISGLQIQRVKNFCFVEPILILAPKELFFVFFCYSKLKARQERERGKIKLRICIAYFPKEKNKNKKT